MGGKSCEAGVIDPVPRRCLNRRMSPALIAIDWGSSSFRAYLMSPDGEVLEEVASGDGIASVAAGEYPATLRRLVGRWLDANRALPAIASGMVGSRHGWREAPMSPAPPARATSPRA